MGHVDKRSITLSPELAAAVDDVVAAGEYASASEVIRDALRQWKERRDSVRLHDRGAAPAGAGGDRQRAGDGWADGHGTTEGQGSTIADGQRP